MTSEQFVWVWLPGRPDPVVAGRVWADRALHRFQYGQSYLSRPDAVGLWGIPLRPGPQQPPSGMDLHGSLRDGLPDAWGQHVIMARLTGRSGQDADTGDLDALTYMRESGSDRFGAIDFQDSPDEYRPRSGSATLAELSEAAAALEAGRPLSAALDAALAHGTSIGGARPKATLTDADGNSWIAKFASSSDGALPRVRWEAFALDLAARAGVVAVQAHMARAAGRDVLLVRRFDRGPAETRVMTVSALTLLDLDERLGRYATYTDLLDKLVSASRDPDAVRVQLFTRIAANIVLGNTDDHARNHAALWDGTYLELSPAYDLDPCRPAGWDANQAMAYGRDGRRRSNLADLVGVSAEYGLSRRRGLEIVNEVVTAISAHWAEALDAAGLTDAQGDALRSSRIMHPAIFDGLVHPVTGGTWSAG